MAFLEQFSDKDRALLVALPYRAGLWVSLADQAGGGKAGHDEMVALEDIVAEKARGMFESAFVHEVMAETCTRQAEWSQWSQNLAAVPSECAFAVQTIAGKLAERDVDAYRANIMSIGLAVAKAFREFDAGASIPVKIWTQIGFFFEALMRIIKRDRSYDAESVLNISYEEDVALSELSRALHPAP